MLEDRIWDLKTRTWGVVIVGKPSRLLTQVVRTVCDAVAKIWFGLLLDMKKNLVATEDTKCAGIPSPSQRHNDTMHLTGQVF
jgi:hypothetical protein